MKRQIIRIGICVLLAVALTAAVARADAYSDVVIADGPVAYFGLNETNGNYFSHDNTYAGVIAGDVVRHTIGPSPRWPSLRQTHLFDGFDLDNVGPVFINAQGGAASKYIAVADAPALDPGTDSITLEAWVYRSAVPTNLSNTAQLFSKMGDAGNLARTGYMLASVTDAASNMTLVASLRDASSIFASVSVPMQTGLWYHVAAVFDRSGAEDTAHLYVNGEFQGTTTSAVLRVGQVSGGASVNIDSPRAFCIGATATSSDSLYGMNGRVDGIAFYKQALSGAQIANHYAAARGRPRGTATPPITNGLMVALQGASAITSTTGRVGIWVDEAALGGYQDFIQATDTNRPVLDSVVMPKGGNPKGVVQFAASSSQYLELGATLGMDTNAFTWFIVFKPVAPVAGTCILLRSAYTSGADVGSGSIWGSFFDSTPNIKVHTRKADRTSKEAVFDASRNLADLDQWFVMGGVWNGASAAFRGQLQDQQDTAYAPQDYTEATAAPAGHIRTRIGSDAASLASYLDGGIAEILIYNTALLQSDVNAVETYLVSKYLVAADTTVFIQ